MRDDADLRIEGVWATVLLDVGEDGTIRPDAIDEQVAVHARSGLDGVYCNGTAGEFHCQTETQFRAVCEATVAAARRHRMPVQVGAAHPLAQGGLSRIRAAAALAPDAIQVTLPDWTPVTVATATRFLEAAAEAAEGIPLVLYNPPHARTVLSPVDLAAVAERIPTLAGLKCGGGDAAWYAAMALLPDRLSVFIPGHYYASGVLAGAHGSYSNMACLSPRGAAAWARQTRSDPDAARDLETRIARFMDDAIAPLLAEGLPGYACDKAMAAAGGWTDISPRLLWPYSGASDTDIERLRRAAARHIPDFLTAEEMAG